LIALITNNVNISISGAICLALSYTPSSHLIFSKNLIARAANFSQLIYDYNCTANWYLFHWVLDGHLIALEFLDSLKEFQAYSHITIVITEHLRNLNCFLRKKKTHTHSSFSIRSVRESNSSRFRNFPWRYVCFISRIDSCCFTQSRLNATLLLHCICSDYKRFSCSHAIVKYPHRVNLSSRES